MTQMPLKCQGPECESKQGSPGKPKPCSQPLASGSVAPPPHGSRASAFPFSSFPFKRTFWGDFLLVANGCSAALATRETWVWSTWRGARRCASACSTCVLSVCGQGAAHVDAQPWAQASSPGHLILSPSHLGFRAWG